MLPSFVSLILSAVIFAVISVIIGSVYPNVQTVLVVIIFFILVLNYYAGYMILMLPVTLSGKVLSQNGLAHTHLNVSKNMGYLLPENWGY